jgi:acyl carrier protein
MKTIEEIILEYIIEHFGNNILQKDRTVHYFYCHFPEEECSCKDLNEITCDTSLISGGYIDSFSMVVVLIFIEKTFNIKIPDKETTPNNFDSVNKIVALINKFKV